MAGNLHNSLVDILVVLGLDTKTGLKPRQEQPAGLNVRDRDELFNTAYEPQLLAAMSANMAVFPLEDPQIDMNYPPKDVPKVMGVKRRRARESVRGITRRISRMEHLSITDITNDDADKKTSKQPSEWPLTPEMIWSLLILCFPEYAYAHREAQEDHVLHLVSTDVEGERSFITCITTYQEYSVIKNKEEKNGLKGDDRSWSLSDGDIGQMICFIPLCFAVISKLPYYNTHKDFLSRLVEKVKADSKRRNELCKEWALQLTRTPLPPAGQIIVKFDLDGIPHYVYPPDYPEKPPVDLQLNLVLQCFILDDVISLICAILCQRRIVFTSSNYASLTVIAECLRNAVLPFEWSFPYVPVLSEAMMEFIEAPGAFIMGCHSRHVEYLQEMPDILIANIDEGELIVGSEVNLPEFPKRPAEIFKAALHKMQTRHMVTACNRPTRFTYTEIKAEKTHELYIQNRDLSRIFLDLMVNIFRDTLQYMRGTKQVFDKQGFLEVQDEANKPFYEEVLCTQMFTQRFLPDRSQKKRDYWSMVEEQTRDVSRPSLAAIYDMHAMMQKSSQPRRDSVGYSLTSKQSPEYTVWELPLFTPHLSQHYYTKLSTDLQANMQDKTCAALKPAFLYLGGILSAAQGKIIEALQEFHKLWVAEPRLFPHKYVRTLLMRMGTREQHELSALSWYKKGDCWRKMSRSKRISMIERPIIVEFSKIPRKSVDDTGFLDHVRLLDLPLDRNVISRLFKALTLDKRNTVDPATFEVFYECWKEIEMEQQTNLHRDLQLDTGEHLLKVSGVIKTSLGMGRLALTQKRLVLFPEGSQTTEVVAKLRDVVRVEEAQQTVFLLKTDVLKITSNHDEEYSCFTANLKNETSLWLHLVKEMWFGRKIAEEHRDLSLTHIAAMHVILMDALYRSSEEEYASHHGALWECLDHMMYFTNQYRDGFSLPPETRAYLQNKIDPNSGEKERDAVEALVYTAGRRLSYEDGQRPKLWCGMGSGKLVICDASTQNIIDMSIKGRDRIVCLEQVGHSFVWAGSFDTCIYVIDSQSHTCVQTLMEHTDIVSDLALSPDGRTMYSVSLKGEVITWDVASMKKQRYKMLEDIRILKSVKIHQNNIWLCAADSILCYTEDWELTHTFRYSNEKEQAEQLDCFAITSNDELWVGCGRSSFLLIWDLNSNKICPIDVIEIKCRGISKILPVRNQIWAASKEGKIHVFDSKSHNQLVTLEAHPTTIRSLCTAQDRYVMSGSGSKEGKVAVWNNKPLVDPSDS